jgi:U2-associated protein SR140
VVEVKLPSDIKQLRLIHLTLEHLLNHGPQFEALLMSRPEVQKDEKWAWLWDARTTGGVYYRWKLWQVITNPRTEKAKAHQPAIIFEGGPTWMPPESDLKFEYTTRLEDFVSDEDYNSSDEENSDGEDERRNRGGAPSEGIDGYGDGLGYMNPMKKAKLTHLLARLPTHQATLRRGDVARITAFAMEHVESGAEEIVDMIVLNVLNPLVYTGANPDCELEKASASTKEPSETAENKDDPASKESSEMTTDEKDILPKKAFDPSGSKLVGLFVISDILSAANNSGVRHSWRYRHLFENAFRTRKVFEHLGRLDKDLNWGRLKARNWKKSVGYLLERWELTNCFTQLNQEHFAQVLEKPPLTDAESHKEEEKVEAEKAAAAFAKSKNRWKTVDEDGLAGKFDPTRPVSDGNRQARSTFTEDESMSDIDGVPMEDSDHELENDEGNPVDKVQLPSGNENIQTQSTQQPTEPPKKPEEPAGHQDPETRRRRPRPKAEDMFASDSE